MNIQVNGKAHDIDASPDTPLLWVLRDHLDLTGTKFGCGMAMCGACTVQVDGQAMRSCLTPVSMVEGRAVLTIEGLGEAGLHAVQKAWQKHIVPQCGYCQSGQIMQAVTFLSSVDDPTDDQIDAVMAGNICRCGTYVRIRAAIKDAAAELRSLRPPEPPPPPAPEAEDVGAE